jgi:hypothetical protein
MLYKGYTTVPVGSYELVGPSVSPCLLAYGGRVQSKRGASVNLR